jgi:hypothetical protein
MVVRPGPDDPSTTPAAALRDLFAQINERLDRLDETLRLRKTSLEDSTRPATDANIESQLIQVTNALERIEETVGRSGSIVQDWLQEISTSMAARFADAEETIRRVEEIVSARTWEQAPPQQPPVPVPVGRLHRFVDMQTDRAVRLPWMARLAVPVLALVTAFAIGALVTTSRGATADTVVSVAAPTTVVGATPSSESVAEPLPASSAIALSASAAPRNRERGGTAPPQSRNGVSASIASSPTTFVGTLSIASVPSGATVSINGKAAGMTPLRLPRQRAGSMAVQIARDGFERWSAAVTVPADRLTEVTARLRPIRPVAVD